MDLELTCKEQEIAKTIKLRKKIGEWLGLGYMLALLSGFGVLGYQALYWLRTAEWLSLSWGSIIIGPDEHLDLPNARGLEIILSWILAMPLFSLPWIAMLVVSWIWEAQEKDPELARVKAKLEAIRFHDTYNNLQE